MRLPTTVKRPPIRNGAFRCPCGPTVITGTVVAILVLAVLNYVFHMSRSHASALRTAETRFRDDLDAAQDKQRVLELELEDRGDQLKAVQQELRACQGEAARAAADASAARAVAATAGMKQASQKGEESSSTGTNTVTLSQRAITPPKEKGVPPPRKAAAGAASHDDDLEPAPANPASARALLIICYNRPDYLTRTLTAVMDRMPTYNRPHIYVSQDGDVAAVTETIAGFKAKFAAKHPDVPFTHWRHPAVPGLDTVQWSGYYKLAQHFGWALDKAFTENGHPFVIVLEDDLEVAVDFFDYFTAVEPLLVGDESLLAASAWNDLGQSNLVEDPNRVYRSDFFPGLGWMLSKHAWHELGPKWPKGFWDDWLREPAQRKGRAFIRPEVSRTYTFGQQGVSQAQFFDQYLGSIKLNAEPVDWSSQDLSYLEPATYDEALRSALKAARQVSVDEATSASCTAASGAAKDVKVVYSGEHGPGGYVALADRFRFINDIKAGVPRTAYQGVTIVRHNGCRKLLVASDSPLLQ